MLSPAALLCVIASFSVGLAQSIDVEGDQWYLETADKSCQLYVIELGAGTETVVILHGGWGAEHSYLFDAFEGMENDYHFVFYDQRGSLRSPCPDSLVSIEKHVEDLETLRHELSLSRLDLIGHSMGSFLALSYLKKYPDRVRKLVLTGCVPVRTPASIKAKKHYQQQQKRLKKFLGRPEIEAELAEEGLSGNPDELNDKEKTYYWRINFAGANVFHVERWRRMKGGQVFYSQKAGTAAGQAMNEGWNFLEEIKSHPYPVTFINGSHDLADFDGAMNRFYLEEVDNAEVVVLENAGHNMWIDQPEQFQREIQRALRKYQ